MYYVFDQRFQRWRDDRGRFVKNSVGEKYLIENRTIHFISKTGKKYRNHEIADRMRYRMIEDQLEKTAKKYYRKTVYTQSLDLSVYFVIINGMMVLTSKKAKVLMASILRVYTQKQKTIRGYLYAEVQVGITKTRQRKVKGKTKMETEHFETEISFSSYQVTDSRKESIDSMILDFQEKSAAALADTPGSDIEVKSHKVEFVLKAW